VLRVRVLQSYQIRLIALCHLELERFESPQMQRQLLSQHLYEKVQLLQLEHLNKFDSLSDHKNLLFEDLFLLFEIGHQLQRFDRQLIGIEVDK
jgi:hypothetical protein